MGSEDQNLIVHSKKSETDYHKGKHFHPIRASKNLSNDWLTDSGASKHMTRFKESFVKLSKHESPHKVKLGDDYQYPIKGSVESSYKLDSGNSMTMKEVLFVPRLKKNLLSIYALDAKGMRVAFVDSQVLMWEK